MNQKVTVITDVKAVRKCWAYDADVRLERLIRRMRQATYRAVNSSDSLTREAWVKGLQQDYRDLGALLETVSKRSQMDDATIENQG